MSLARSAAPLAVSAALQMLVALLAVPAYLRLIGGERYGILVLAWLLFDYAGFCGLGLDRALARNVAAAADERLPQGTLLVIGAAVGMAALGAVGLVLCLPPLLMHLLGVPGPTMAEAGNAWPWVAAALPFSVLGTHFGALLQARQRFVLLGMSQLGQAAATQLLPLAAAFCAGPHLEVLLVAGAAARLVAPALLLGLLLPSLLHGGTPAAPTMPARPMLRYGLWTTVTNGISPLLVNLDRMIIGATLGPAAVAAYAIPLNLLSRAQVLPMAVQAVLFPRLAGSHRSVAPLARQAVLDLAALLAPLLIVAALGLDEFLRLWLGAARDGTQTDVGTALIPGLYLNSLAFIPFSRLAAAGRPDVTARLHALEILPFFGGLWLAVHTFAITGAALAWSVRAIADAALLFWLAGRQDGTRLPAVQPLILVTASAMLGSSLGEALSIWKWPLAAMLLLLQLRWSLHRLVRRPSSHGTDPGRTVGRAVDARG